MKQINSLTGLRGIAAYSVLLAHAISGSFGYNGVNLLQPFAQRLAYFGMSLFFVLSGFVIHYNYAKLIKVKGYLVGVYEFFVARIARLYPLYALVIICSLDSIPSGLFHNKQSAELAYLTLTQSWFNLECIIFPPAWSISTECFFYFAFVLLLPFFEAIRKPVLTLSVFLVLTFFFLPNLIDHQLHLNPEGLPWIIYFSPFTRIFDFIAGVFASKIYLSLAEERKANTLEMAGMIAALVWCLLILFVDPLAHTKYRILLSNFVYTPAIAPFLILCCRFNTFFSRFLCRSKLIFMGEISYSVYLLGFMVIAALGNTYVWHKPTLMAHINSSLKVISILSLTTIFAYGGFNLIERPSRQFIRKILSLREKEKALAPSTL